MVTTHNLLARDGNTFFLDLEPRLRWKLRIYQIIQRQDPKRYTVTGVFGDKQKLKFKEEADRRGR